MAKSDKLDRIMWAAGRYRIVFAESIALALGESKKQTVRLLKQLEADDLLQCYKGAASIGGTPYWTLTRAGCAKFGFPHDRSETFSGSAVSNHVAITWHCLVESEGNTRRVENEELKTVFDEVPHRNQIHAVVNDNGRFRVARVYVPVTDTSGITKWVISHIEAAKAKHEDLLAERDFGFLILMQRKSACGPIRRELQRPRGRFPSLEKQAWIRVGLGPSTETFATEFSRRFSGK